MLGTERCSLPKNTGSTECSGNHARWYYSETESKCMPFYFTGCEGNQNNFLSLEKCEEHCPKQIGKGFYWSLVVVQPAL